MFVIVSVRGDINIFAESLRQENLFAVVYVGARQLFVNICYDFEN